MSIAEHGTSMTSYGTAANPDNATVAEALHESERRYVRENPKSAAQARQAARHLPGGNTRVALHYDPFPIVIARAAGSSVTDLDGHTYLDFANDLTAALFGHSNPLVIGALVQALDSGLSYGGASVHEADLAEAICDRFPSIERVRFCNSGTEANLIASQLARAVTRRSILLAFSGGYHGSAMNYSSGAAALNVEVARVVLACFNDPESVRRAVAESGSDLAAIIVEPMMGSAGGIVAEQSFLQLLRDLATAAGALLIFDEVQTARLSYGGMQEVYGIVPDLTTLGKFVGGGLSFGAVGGRADIIDRLDPARQDCIVHGGTFNNNVLTMVAGRTGLVEVATRAALNALNQRGERLRVALGEIARARKIPLWVGGFGSILSLHFQPDPPRHAGAVRTPAAWRKLLHLELLLRSIYCARRGTLNLSLATTDEDCILFAGAFAEVLDKHGDSVVPALRENQP